MAGTGLKITVDASGPQRMLRKLDLALTSSGLQIFLGTAVGPYLKKRASDRFASEGDDVTGKWAELLPATQAIRQMGQWPVGASHPINRRSGELENWVTKSNVLAVPTSTGAALQYPRDAPKGELRKKVKTAQEGGQAPNARNPTVPRPVLGVNETDLAAISQMLIFYLDRAVQ